MAVRLVIVVADGMADLRYPELGGHSPVEQARTPGMDEIVRRGQVGLAQTMYAGLPLGSLTGLLGILGCHPPSCFPVSRSLFEARALGFSVSATDLVCRCNIVQVSPDGRLVDFTAGQISDVAAHRYLRELDIEAGFELQHDLSYRNVLIVRNCPLELDQIELFEPHENVGGHIDALLPRYRGEVIEPFARLMRSSRRGQLMLWMWGAGRSRTLPQVSYRLVTVTALRFLSGLTEALGGTGLIPKGATGYRGSDLGAKLEAAKENLATADVCMIHCNAPDEEAHIGCVQGKVEAIEEIDRLVVSPLLRHLSTSDQPYRVWLLPDHYTVCQSGRHLLSPVPFAVCGPGITHDHGLTRFSEVEIGEQSASQPVLESCQFIPALLADRPSSA